MLAVAPYRFEALAAQHDVSSFRSGNTAIDTFLWNEALPEALQDRSRTFVLLDTGIASPAEIVIGFFTLKADGIWTTGLPSADPPAYLPAAELAYLARHLSRRGQGFGGLLLVEALRVVSEAARWIGIAGISLYATNEGLRLYERAGFQRYGVEDRRMFLSLKSARVILSTPT